MKIITSQSSNMLDYLLRIMPDLAVQKKEFVDVKAANTLFSLWKNSQKQNIDKKIIEKPTTLSMNDVEQMESNGLVKSMGSNIEITSKGASVLKIMILGNDKSVFDDKGRITDYATSLAQSQNPTVKSAKSKNTKMAQENQWWNRLSTKD